MTTRRGVVYLVGAGPGDPSLITIRGLELLRSADVVVYDRLIGPELLGETRPGAELIAVGKAPGQHRVPQSQINGLLVDRASRGRRVVRLKGGDPFVFGRGFEEVCACHAADVPCEVVPGVSSAIAAATAAGIPLTDRRLVRSVAVFSGTQASDSPASELCFDALSRMDTLVVLMGRSALAEIARRLVASGRDPDTPAASIEWATTPAQRTVAATLGTIARTVERAGISSPMVTVIGAVAAHARAGQERADAPLAGRRILIARPLSWRSRLRTLLGQAGAITFACPVLDIRYVSGRDAEPLGCAVRELQKYAWVLFRSAHGVRGLWRCLRMLGGDARWFGGCRLVTGGPAASRALRSHGLEPDLEVRDCCGEAIATAVSEVSDRRLGRMLLAGSDDMDRNLAMALSAAGGEVDLVTAYRVSERPLPEELREIVARGLDAVTVCSPSAALAFRRLGIPTEGAAIACIGPGTAEVARGVGLRVDVVAEQPSSESLAAGLVSWFSATAAHPIR